MIPIGDDWGSVIESRKRWIRRRFAKLERGAVLVGFIDVSANRDMSEKWSWSIHEHFVVSLTAPTMARAISQVRAAFRPLPHESRGVERPIMVAEASHPLGYLAYASRTLLPFNVLTREDYVRQGEPGKSHHKLRGAQRHELLRNLESVRPADRVLLGGIRRDGKRLRPSRRR
jgi:hypothetical protein